MGYGMSGFRLPRFDGEDFGGSNLLLRRMSLADTYADTYTDTFTHTYIDPVC